MQTSFDANVLDYDDFSPGYQFGPRHCDSTLMQRFRDIEGTLVDNVITLHKCTSVILKLFKQIDFPSTALYSR